MDHKYDYPKQPCDENYTARNFTISLSPAVIEILRGECARLGFTRLYRGKQVPCISHWLNAVAAKIESETKGEV